MSNRIPRNATIMNVTFKIDLSYHPAGTTATLHKTPHGWTETTESGKTYLFFISHLRNSDIVQIDDIIKTAPAAPSKPRTIKTRTYNNFMRVYKMILAKGYDKTTAEDITRNIFDRYEANPDGLPIMSIVNQIAPAKMD